MIEILLLGATFAIFIGIIYFFDRRATTQGALFTGQATLWKRGVAFILALFFGVLAIDNFFRMAYFTFISRLWLWL